MCNTAVLYQQFVRIGKKLVHRCVTVSDEPVILLDLWLAIHIPFELKRNSLLICIESLPERKDDGGDQQVTPELLNKMFSAKATCQILL